MFAAGAAIAATGCTRAVKTYAFGGQTFETREECEAARAEAQRSAALRGAVLGGPAGAAAGAARQSFNNRIRSC